MWLQPLLVDSIDNNLIGDAVSSINIFVNINKVRSYMLWELAACGWSVCGYEVHGIRL